MSLSLSAFQIDRTDKGSMSSVVYGGGDDDAGVGCWVEEEEEQCFNVSGISLEVTKTGSGAGRGGNRAVERYKQPRLPPHPSQNEQCVVLWEVQHVFLDL